MIMLLSVTLKVALLALITLAATALLHRRSAAMRHFVLTTMFLCALGVPAVEQTMPSWPVSLPPLWETSPVTSSLRLVSSAPGIPANADSAVSEPINQGGFSVTTWLLSIWVAGTVLGCVGLLAGLLRLRRLAADATPVTSGAWREIADQISRLYGVRRPVRIVSCAYPTMLATWGVTKPTILLPAGAEDWPADRVHAVVCHELAHIRRGDWGIALLANMLRVAYWFNPLLWIACRRLRHEGEQACDDLVLASGISGAEYATHLLAVARHSATHRHPWSPAIAIAHHSMLEGRVRAMLNTRVNREPLSVRTCAISVAALVAVTMAIGIVTVSGETTRPAAANPLTPTGMLPVISVEQSDRPLAAQSAAVGTAAAQSQSSSGAIEGVLYDQFGGLLPGAAVRLTQISSGSTQSGATDRSGAFVFRRLAAGDYELVTELPGFITVKNVLRAEEGQTTRRHITLPIGTIEETIHVTCSSTSRVTSPTSPTGSTSPGPSQRTAAPVQRGAEPKVAANTFTGGIGGQIRAPKKTVHVNPICPPTTSAGSMVVRLAGRIGIDGLLTDLQDVGSEAQPEYVASALEAVRQWVFTPTLLNNTPVEVNIKMTLTYNSN